MLLRLIKTYLRPYASLVVFLIIFQIAQVFTTLLLPTLNAAIVNRGVANGDTGLVWSLGGAMLGVSVVQIVTNVIAIVLGVLVAMRAARDIRTDFFDHIMEFGHKEVARFGTSSLVTRNTNDIRQIQQFLQMTTMMLVMAPVMAIGGLVMALVQDIRLSWLIVVVVVVLSVVLFVLVRKMVPSFQVMQERIDSISSVLSQQLTGLRVIRAFVKEDTEAKRFAEANHDVTNAQLNVGKYFVLLFPAVMAIVNLGTVAVVWFGAVQIENGHTDVGTVMAFIQYLMLILMGVMFVAFMSMMIPRAEVAAGRVLEVIETEPEMDRDSGTLATLPEPGLIEFDEVGFRYPGADAHVLSDVSFRIEPGTTAAVIGATGSGKSHLVRLLLRLLDASEGEVRIGGVPIADIDQETYATLFGYVPQQPHVFGDTVAGNLRIGAPDADEERMWEALRIASAEEYVADFADGLDHPINQGGTNLSGGQRQRLAIAMAVCRRSPYLVFDDSFSALDTRTDRAVRHALATRTEATTFIVTQRVSSAMNADVVIVVDAGRVVDLGTHAELMDSSQVYREIVDSQLTEEDA